MSNDADARLELSLLLDDAPVLAVNKPAGWLTQAPAGIPSLESEVKRFLKERFHKPGNVYLGIPQRLDRAVSGVIVFARNSKAAARLAEQFAQRQVQKTYWAILEHAPQCDRGELTDWLRKLPQQSRAEIVAAGTKGARECRLAYRVLGHCSAGALVEVAAHTGRMHQIRLQFASRGCPIVGDVQYASTQRLIDTPVANPREEPIALHARSLRFLHPIRYDPVVVTAPTPHDWPNLSEGLRNSYSSEILGD